jgi:two-component system, NtrC family, response regulator AtoC
MNNAMLVVDDERDFVETLKRGFITSGYKNLSMLMDPMAASKSVEAGEHHGNTLLDVTMPSLS